MATQNSGDGGPIIIDPDSAKKITAHLGRIADHLGQIAGHLERVAKNSDDNGPVPKDPDKKKARKRPARS
jgi:hypothetical protein